MVSLKELVAGVNLVKVGCYGENAMLDNLNGLMVMQSTSFCTRCGDVFHSCKYSMCLHNLISLVH